MIPFRFLNGHSYLCRAVLGLFVFLLAGVVPAGSRLSQAQAESDWPGIDLAPVAEGFDSPTHVTHAGDNSGRLFVVEQEGRIRIIKNGALLADPFLDIVDDVSCCGERGLLSMAFPPGDGNKRHFYVNYTDNAGDTVVARFAVDPQNPDRADPATRAIILPIPQPYENHNGGQIAFGPDGYLYIGMGDGGDSGDPQDRAQDTQELLGKLLRIEVDPADGASYRVPATNPFTQTAGYQPEIWALGLRNPWRFSFDRDTGDLYIADVGQGRYEEVNLQPSTSTGGENYGWNIMEGMHCFGATTCDTTGLTLPIFEYDHSQGDRSITGGFVYRGANYPVLDGIYFYADYISGRIWGLRQAGDTWENAELYDASFLISSFGEDAAGNLLLVDYSNGKIYEITARTVGSANTTVYMPLLLY